MESTQIRAQIQTHVDQLSSERLKVVLDFLAYLVAKEAEDDTATLELLAIPNFTQDLAAAEKRAADGETVEWRTVRKDA